MNSNSDGQNGSTASHVVEVKTVPLPMAKANGQVPAKKNKGGKPTTTEIEKAAMQAGFTPVMAKQFESQGNLGAMVGRMGVIDMGRGKLLFAQHHMEQSLEYLDAMARETADFDQRLAVQKAKSDLCKAHILAGKELIRSSGNGRSESSQPRQSNPSYPPGMAVQVNVNPKKESL